ncbi:MAG: aspartate ammonia-lyase [Phycisphaerae bacterium]|jgi:aspartate ammonia-lyase|nr:aspartate ammonia-lyase [Phycisphaerae bacterium]
MPDYRTETDSLGSLEIPADALHGIHTQRAVENFPLTGRPVNAELIGAYGAVKLACARTNRELGMWDDATFEAIQSACEEMARGELDEHIIVDALQGGAGTSTNMNVNEVLANRALQILSNPLGDYQTISPLDDINAHQSTNDTYPTALKVAAMNMLTGLERKVVALLEEFQRQEKACADIVKVARTQYQDAVLITLGREMGAYAEAFGRDRWRIYKCNERLRVVNLGGTAVGTGLGAPRQFIFQAVEHLRTITSLGLARAENLVEATQNTDVFVEVSGILKALASNLLKTAGDLRLLSSGPAAGLGEISLPPRQAGSSIMPGKVNPVIPEAVSQAAMVVMANDQVIAQACSAGSLELNAFMPLIADSLLGSLGLLTGACEILRSRCVEGIEPNTAVCGANVDGATATITALVETIGYQAAEEVARQARDGAKSIRRIVIDLELLTGGQFDELVSPQRVMRLGSVPKPNDERGS